MLANYMLTVEKWANCHQKLIKNCTYFSSVSRFI